MTGRPVPVHGLHLHWVFGSLVGLDDGSLRACSSALSHSTDDGIGVEPLLSCGSYAGGAEFDELDEEEVVDKPKHHF